MSQKAPRIVLVFGVFDLFHPGHEYFLRQARRQGDRLVAVVTRDERVEQEKGRRPARTLAARLADVRQFGCVDRALPGDRVGEWGLVRRLRPAVICVGHDQRTDHPKFLAQLAGLTPPPQIVRLPAFKRDQYSTTRLREYSVPVPGSSVSEPVIRLRDRE